MQSIWQVVISNRLGSLQPQDKETCRNQHDSTVFLSLGTGTGFALAWNLVVVSTDKDLTFNTFLPSTHS